MESAEEFLRKKLDVELPIQNIYYKIAWFVMVQMLEEFAEENKNNRRDISRQGLEQAHSED